MVCEPKPELNWRFANSKLQRTVEKKSETEWIKDEADMLHERKTHVLGVECECDVCKKRVFHVDVCTANGVQWATTGRSLRSAETEA